MRTILENRSDTGKTKVQQVIYGTPTPGTYGDYWLMKEDLRSQDDIWSTKHQSKWEQLHFNTAFLEVMLANFKELHCEYCGRPNLIIYKWNEKKIRINMATVDHFIPKSFDKARLTYNVSNLLVCCDSCNAKKADKMWDETTIKFKYSVDPKAIENQINIQLNHKEKLQN